MKELSASVLIAVSPSSRVPVDAPIVITLIAVIIINEAVAFLMFRKRSKTKPASG